MNGHAIQFNSCSAFNGRYYRNAALQKSRCRFKSLTNKPEVTAVRIHSPRRHEGEPLRGTRTQKGTRPPLGDDSRQWDYKTCVEEPSQTVLSVYEQIRSKNPGWDEQQDSLLGGSFEILVAFFLRVKHCDYTHTHTHLFCIALVPDHLLDEELGFAVRVCTASSGVLLVDGEFLRIAVHRCRTTEHYIMYPMGLHHLQHTWRHHYSVYVQFFFFNPSFFKHQ